MQLKIEYVPKEELKPYANNAKIHTAEQVEQIKASIAEFGFIDPIAVWKDNEIIEGHGRLLALMEMDGYDKVPIIRLDSLTDEQRRAYTLIHNKLTMNTDFDVELLEIELDGISDIDMGEYGFEIAEIDATEVDTDVDSQSSFNYKEQYGVIVVCEGEAEQEEVYNKLVADGYNCRVVAV